MAVEEEAKTELGLVHNLRQCLLRKEVTPGTYMYTTEWIPEQFARLDAMLVIDDKPGLWRVLTVGTRQSIEYLGQFRDDYRHQREASDI